MPERSTTARIADAAGRRGGPRERAAVAADRRADGLDDPRLAHRSVKIAAHEAIVARSREFEPIR